MSRARDFADLAGSADAGGLTGRNLIINGSASVNQRGDVTGKTATSYGGPDRFELGISSIGTYSISQSSTSPDGFANSYKVDCTTADASPASGDFLVISHKIEAQNLQHLQYGTSGAKKITLSFYARSNKTGTYAVELIASDANKHICQTFTINSADSWEKKEITFVGNTADVINDDNGIGMYVNWWLGVGSGFTSGTLATSWATRTTANIAVGQTVNIADNTANEFLLTGVQLEVGSTATDFDHSESYGETLAKCQRYFQTLRGNDRYPGDSGNANVVFGSGNLLQTPMRAQPSLSVSGALSFDEYYVSGRTQSSGHVARNSGDAQCVIASFSNFTGLTRGNPGAIYNANIDIDAEL